MFDFNTVAKQTKSAAMPVNGKVSVKTIDTENDNALDLSSLFAFGQKANAMTVRPTDKNKQDSEVEAVMKAGEQLSKKHKQYHNDYIVRGNQALYELLAEIYALALKINMSAAKENILAAMRDALKERNIKTQANTPPLTTVIKFVVGADRQTASNYNRVLNVAFDENLAATELAAYISRRGGIGQIFTTEAEADAKKTGAKQSKERLDILRECLELQQFTSAAAFKFDGAMKQHNADKQGASETGSFCFFMTVYDQQNDVYRIIDGHDLGKTYEDALLRVLFKNAPNDIDTLKKGLRQFQQNLIDDKKVPDALIEILQERLAKQDRKEGLVIDNAQEE